MIIIYCENQMSEHVLTETKNCFSDLLVEMLNGCIRKNPHDALEQHCVLCLNIVIADCVIVVQRNRHISCSYYIIKVLCDYDVIHRLILYIEGLLFVPRCFFHMNQNVTLSFSL